MSEFVEIKTDELTRAALDWAVMVCVKGEKTKHEFEDGKLFLLVSKQLLGHCHEMSQPFMPSTRWQECGPLIDKFNIDITVECKGLLYASVCDDSGMPVMPGDANGAFGPTHLIAACRAIVASVLGETVSVPKELLS